MVPRTSEKISGIFWRATGAFTRCPPEPGGKGLHERWLQTRPRKTVELMENPSSENLFPRQRSLPALASRSLRSWSSKTSCNDPQHAWSNSSKNHKTRLLNTTEFTAPNFCTTGTRKLTAKPKKHPRRVWSPRTLLTRKGLPALTHLIVSPSGAFRYQSGVHRV